MKPLDFYRELILMLLVAFSIQVFSKETRIKIVVMDTGIKFSQENNKYLCRGLHADFTGTGLDDNNGHGTNVAGLIARNIDYRKYCIVVLKFYNTNEVPSLNTQGDTLIPAWNYILELNPAFVNLSYSGKGYWPQERELLRRLTARGTKVTVAAGNDHTDLRFNCIYFPACYNLRKNFYVVSARDVASANFNGPVNAFAEGSFQEAWGVTETGTSQATANFTNYLILTDSK